jgi:hypothetical protein
VDPTAQAAIEKKKTGATYFTLSSYSMRTRRLRTRVEEPTPDAVPK